MTRQEAADAELGELAELHGTHIDDCVRVARLVLADPDKAEAAAVQAFVLAHRRWYRSDDHVLELHRGLVRATGRAARTPPPRPVDPLLATAAAVPVDQRTAAALAAVTGRRGAALAAALRTDEARAEDLRRSGEDALAAALDPGTDVAAVCATLPGVRDPDESLLAVLRGVTHQVHVRSRPRWVPLLLVLGVLLILAGIVLSIDWG